MWYHFQPDVPVGHVPQLSWRGNPYNVVVEPPSLEPLDPARVQACLNYFQVTLPMVIQDVTCRWPLFMVDDEVAYEVMAEEVPTNNSIYRSPDESDYWAVQGYYAQFEVLMDIIYLIRDHFKAMLQGTMDVHNENDMTTLQCIQCQPDYVMIHVEPAFG